MYSVDQYDSVIELDNLPQSDIGAPLPFVMCDDYRLVLAYFVHQPPPPGWHGESIRMVDPRTAVDTIAVVEFEGAYAVYFGPPNDEAFKGHPLFGRGLHPYAAFQVLNSSWVRHLERMNSVHPHHSPKSFEKFNHYILAFHDSTFECVAYGYSVSQHTGPRQKVVLAMQKLLKWS